LVFEAHPAGSEARLALEKAFIADLAKSLNMDPSRLKISGMSPGSIIIKFDISEGPEGESSSESLLESLLEQIHDPMSPLLQGNTPTIHLQCNTPTIHLQCNTPTIQ